VKTIVRPSGETLTLRTDWSSKLVSCSGQPPVARTRQRLNCPERSEEKSSRRPFGVKVNVGWKRRIAKNCSNRGGALRRVLRRATVSTAASLSSAS
jgi:hypothetical protein